MEGQRHDGKPRYKRRNRIEGRKNKARGRKEER